MDTRARRERMQALHQQWKGRHTCGVGSRPENVKNAIHILSLVIQHLDIRSVLDAGCGDQSWIHEAIPGHVKYRGVDLIPWTPEVRVLDFVDHDIPGVDVQERPYLVFCRTVLIHLDAADVASALVNFMDRADFLLATHNPRGYNEGSQLPVGEPWNLAAPPFSLGEPLAMYEDCNNMLGLWGLN